MLMDISMPGGRYVVAISGGVDSMVLLDLLVRQADLKLIVAHYDHGIRPDSSLDRKLVQQAAQRYGLQFVYDLGNLGPNTSEATARKARYQFLYNVQGTAKAQAIITAHHQDDLAETAILNILRGTGRRGLTSLRSTDVIKRPLLGNAKSEIRQYAKDNQITWREDTTNSDTTYLRNYIRNVLIPKLDDEAYQQLLSHIKTAQDLNHQIDEQLVNHLHVQTSHTKIDRHYFVMLPNTVANEVMAAWLKKTGVKDVDKKLIHKLTQIAKTSPSNRVADVDKQFILRITSRYLALEHRDR